jgi:hypothetical protein
VSWNISKLCWVEGIEACESKIQNICFWCKSSLKINAADTNIGLRCFNKFYPVLETCCEENSVLS